jgi:SAM-dependent methyltransferase
MKEKPATFSTGFERSKLQTYLSLLKQYRGNQREFALWDYRRFGQVQAVVKQFVGRPLTELDVLEIGSGQRFASALLFHSAGARVIGIDMDFVATQPSLRSLAATWRRNGWERAVKTTVRQLLFDPAYYRALSEVSGLPLKRRTVPLQVMDACALDFPDNRFDLLYSSDVFEHLYDVDAAAREAARVLRPDGVAMIGLNLFPSLSGGHHFEWSDPDGAASRQVPPWDHLRQNRYPPQTYLNKLRERDYRAAFGRYFTILEVREHSQGAQHLTDDILRELTGFSREELLKDSITLVLSKSAGG